MAIDQGLDILKVTASLESFVESYCYDLKEQYPVRSSREVQRLDCEAGHNSQRPNSSRSIWTSNCREIGNTLGFVRMLQSAILECELFYGRDGFRISRQCD
ncbi:unnamed protein product [Bursaphelenchus xylophilus]|uniref:(pine wood nematode) hypothetical protein n=1 Tax=Bursaphelenchus xylophilus TaxID=6326 RepID=A0A811KCY2_BURXY|nr:unnamed protein product [Bursaphelenchus xylophilus]CAG9091991.1 unnamed protein product [Bursaphelenchus xylophilus]